MKQTNYYKLFFKIIEELKKSYPHLTVARHLSTALSDYGDFWGITDKELCFALEKYQAELALDETNVASDDYVERIIKDTESLFNPQEDEEEEEDIY